MLDLIGDILDAIHSAEAELEDVEKKLDEKPGNTRLLIKRIKRKDRIQELWMEYNEMTNL